MSKNCPKCGKRLPDDAKFCFDCGYSFKGGKTSIFSNGKIFLVLIIAVLAIGGIFLLSSSNNQDNNSSDAVDDGTHVFLTITEVGGWDNGDDSSKNRYTLYTSAFFSKVPSNLDGYLVKTIYYDKDNSQIGQETESLEQVYYDSDYSISFGHYITYTKPNPDHVVVQIIKDGNIIDNYTETIDQSKIDYLN